MVVLTGNEVEAEAMRQINPHVVAAYPITPQTEIIQLFTGYVVDGRVDTELIRVESEHSAMSACIGAAAAGCRVMTATSSQGLALMWEVLYIAASLRLPIVMAVVNRALSGNINIHCDHSDSMGARDAGWVQLFSSNVQEAYDTMIQAVRVAEQACLPVMVMTDGFLTSHEAEPVLLYPDDQVRAFIGPYRPGYALLDVDHPITVGPLDFHDYYFEHKRSQAAAITDAAGVIDQVAREFEQAFGSRYHAVEPYRLHDATVGIVAIGSTCGTAEEAVDAARSRGIAAGLLKLRVFRPFPLPQIVAGLRHVHAVAVMDRSDGMAGWGGPVGVEIKAALYGLAERPTVIDYVYGLGGREITVEDLVEVCEELHGIADGQDGGEPVRYLGVREEGAIHEPENARREA
ncbi:MAG: pyruvate ferredoxin oxidoreductase [Candidatus Latescibacteria bacterium]|nr:pyruvate ferredoxin oxidoreductase [Candidatus Latescibacterota bacterium]